MVNNEDKKLTLEEYEKAYNEKPKNVKTIRTFLTLFAATIGIVICTCLIFLVIKLFEMHKIAGYAGCGIALVVFIFAYIVPLYKIKKTKAFITTVNIGNAKEAKKYNKALREELADKIIDFHTKTDNIGWYSDANVGKLAIARQTKNDSALKEALSDTFNSDVAKSANHIIRDHAVRVGVSTAISQSEKLDTIFVSLYELDLIKQLVFLYGYRPSEAELMKIYRNVLTNALVAYGLNSATNGLATGIVNKMGKASSSIPVLGGLISQIIESASQGVINASLTVVIGFQTKKYLKKEYKLQDILDNVQLGDDEESEANMINEVKIVVSKEEGKGK